VSHLLAPEALSELLEWLGDAQQFSHLLPSTSSRQHIMRDFQRELPLPFFASQRLVLADGRVVLDLLVSKDSASLACGPWLPEQLDGCRITRRHDIKAPRIAILGSGLAGCNLAHALASRGARVSVFERSALAHTGASGNRQGALYIKPALAWSRENRLHVLSYQFAHRFYQRQFGRESHSEAGPRPPWQHCGVLHLAQNERERARMSQLHQQAVYPERFIRSLSFRDAARLAGADLDCPAAAMPQGGTLEPAKLCEHLLAAHDIQVLTHQSVQTGDWDAVVWAGGHPQAGDELAPTHLPLRPIRGQISSVCIAADNTLSMAQMPNQVLSGDGYVMPPLLNTDSTVWLTFGASYAVNRSDRGISEEEMSDNSRQLARTLPELAAQLDSTGISREERAAIRCASTDYMPVVGNARIPHGRNSASQNHSLAETLCQEGRLWYMTAFGSKGLALAPLLAEQLACAILAEPTPLEPDLAEGIDPDRWARRAALKGYSPSTGGTG